MELFYLLFFVTCGQLSATWPPEYAHFSLQAPEVNKCFLFLLWIVYIWLFIFILLSNFLSSIHTSNCQSCPSVRLSVRMSFCPYVQSFVPIICLCFSTKRRGTLLSELRVCFGDISLKFDGQKNLFYIKHCDFFWQICWVIATRTPLLFIKWLNK